MTTQTWINPAIDRTGWGAGEWDGEPDKVQWTDAATQLPCLAVRHFELGHWCGYVGVHAGHPLHGMHADALPYLEMHGGVNRTAGCDHGPIEGSICHVPAPGEPDDTWWLGFDCAHAWDFSPGIAAALRRLPGYEPRPRDDAYRTLEYVREQCGRLAGQLDALRSGDA